MEKENIDITEVLKNFSYKDDNIVVFKDILFAFIKSDLKITISVLNKNNWSFVHSFDIYDKIDHLVYCLQQSSKQCNFYVTNTKYLPIKYIMKEGEYWKMNKENKCCNNCKHWNYYKGCSLYKNKDDYYDIHNNKGYFYSYCCKDWKDENMKTIDSCENKDKICKLRAECMAEIVEQKNKFDIEEEFKNICIKERETILENIHKAIEDEAKLANRKIEFSLFKYMTKDFKVIDYHSDFYYNTGYESENIKFKNHYYCSMDIRHHYLIEILNDYKSYVWKFVNKLDYDTAKRICHAYLYDCIKQILEKEGFVVETKEEYEYMYIVRW